MVTGPYTAFSNKKKIVTILHRELEHKVEKVQHMKLEVMWPKTKNNMNFQPEKNHNRSGHVNCVLRIRMDGGGGGGLLTFLL